MCCQSNFRQGRCLVGIFDLQTTCSKEVEPAPCSPRWWERNKVAIAPCRRLLIMSFVSLEDRCLSNLTESLQAHGAHCCWLTKHRSRNSQILNLPQILNTDHHTSRFRSRMSCPTWLIRIVITILVSPLNSSFARRSVPLLASTLRLGGASVVVIRRLLVGGQSIAGGSTTTRSMGLACPGRFVVQVES